MNIASARGWIKEQQKKEALQGHLENLYLLVFALFLTYRFFAATTFPFFEWSFRLNVLYCVLTFGITTLRLWVSRPYTVRELLPLAVVEGLLVLIVLINHSEELMCLAMLIYGAYRISGKKLIRVHFTLCSVLACLTVLAASAGWIEGYVYVQAGHRIRRAMGFAYPTDFAAHIFFLTLEYAFLRGEKIRKIELAILAGIGIAVFWLSDARTNFLCTMLFLIGLAIYQEVRRFYAKREKEFTIPMWMGRIAAFWPVICTSIILILTKCYQMGYPFAQKADGWLSSRLRMSAVGFERYQLNLWGQFVEMNGFGWGESVDAENYFFLDSSYVSVLLQYGMVSLLFILALVVWIAWKAMNQGNWILVWIVMILSTACLMEHHLLNPSQHIFFILVFALGWAGKRKVTKD